MEAIERQLKIRGRVGRRSGTKRDQNLILFIFTCFNGEARTEERVAKVDFGRSRGGGDRKASGTWQEQGRRT